MALLTPPVEVEPYTIFLKFYEMQGKIKAFKETSNV